VVFASWRGVVGVVKPTHRPGSLEEFIRLMPEGIGVVPVYLNFRRGTEDEFRAALTAVEEKVAELANEGVDLIHPEGAPPFMVHGYAGEEKIIKEWEAKYKTPMVTAAQTQVEALRAFNIKQFVGVTYFVGSVTRLPADTSKKPVSTSWEWKACRWRSRMSVVLRRKKFTPTRARRS
jgi:maleate cis-trans isomerase